MGKSAAELALKNDLLRRLVRELIQPDEKKEPLKIYADDKESYFQAKYIPIHVTNGDGGETEYVGDVILLKISLNSRNWTLPRRLLSPLSPMS